MKPINGYHRTVCKWLSELGISYMEEYPVDQYSLDIYIKELDLGVEIDGPQHNRKKDALRDEIIQKKYDIPIVRIPVGTSKVKALEEIFGAGAH